jgi:hypothetical protein
MYQYMSDGRFMSFHKETTYENKYQDYIIIIYSFFWHYGLNERYFKGSQVSLIIVAIFSQFQRMLINCVTVLPTVIVGKK